MAACYTRRMPEVVPGEVDENIDADQADQANAADVVPRSARRTWVRRSVIATLAAVGAVLLGLVATNLVVTRGAEGLAFDDVADMPTRPVAIVFGAGVVNGQPTPALSDRVHGAAELYKAGKVSHLLMTGDNSNVAYDEVSVMREAAMKEGVPSSAITRDYAGLSTFDSCVRARDVFGVRSAVLVTQDYHLSRALFTCRDLGIDAVGLRVPDWQHLPERMVWGNYPLGNQVSYMTREWLARTKAVIGAKVTHPEPIVGGPFVGLVEN